MAASRVSRAPPSASHRHPDAPTPTLPEVNQDPPQAPIESYELELEQRGWRKALAWATTLKGALIVLAVLALVLGVWQGRPIYNAVKSWRAGKLVARCEAAALAGDEAAEVRFLREAFALQPSTPLTLRALAHYHERRGEGAALAAYEKVLASDQATTDDSIRAARLALQLGKVELSRKLLADLRRDPQTSELPTVLTIQARLLAIDGNWKDAIATASHAVEKSADPGPEKMVLATLLLQAADRVPPAQREPLARQSVGLLAELATRTDNTGVEALTALVSLARQPTIASLLAGHDVTSWVEAAQQHPKAPPRLRVLAWDLQLAAKKEDAEKFFAAFLEKSQNVPLAQRLEAARWLNQHGKPALSLELSTPEKESSPDWFLVFLDGLAATGKWPAVLAQLGEKSGQAAAMPGALRSLFQFRARTELKQPLNRDDTWRDLQIQLQQETVRNQLFVAQYAEKTGERRQASLIYRRLLDDANSQANFEKAMSAEEKFACHSGIMRGISETAPAAQMLPLYEALIKDFPEMDEARNDTIYLRLITGGAPTEQMQKDVSDLLNRKPNMLAYRTTGALYELRRGNPTGAVKLYEGWKIDWSTAADRFKAVKVAALLADGHKSEAEELLATIDRKKLRPEEAALLDGK